MGTADNIRRLRRQLGLSKAELARKAKASQTYVGQLERGERGGTRAKLETSAQALGVSYAQLVADEAEPVAPSQIPVVGELIGEGKLVRDEDREQEREANRFAAELLMPWAGVQELRDLDAGQLAGRYGVSFEAARIRKSEVFRA